MPKIIDDKFREIVDYITTPPYHNITDTAAHLGVSGRTVSVHLKRLSTPTDAQFNLEKAQEVNQILEHLLSISRAKSGSSSHRSFTFTEEEALELRFKNLYLGLSTRDLAALYGCSHMTVYNAINNLSNTAKEVQDEEVRKMMEEKDRLLQEESGSKWTR